MPTRLSIYELLQRSSIMLLMWGIFCAGECLIPNETFAQEPTPISAAPPIAQVGSLTQPSEYELGKEQMLIQDVYDPELLLHLEPSQSIIIRTRFPVTRTAVSHNDICDVQPFGTDEIEIIGKKVGRSTLTFWFDTGSRVELLRYMVKVDNVQEKQVERELRYRQLQARINEIFPESQVFLFPIEDKVIVKGQARDAKEASEIMRLLGQTNQSSLPSVTGQPTNRSLNPNDPLNYGGVTPYQFINMLKVPGEQQVMLKVRVAELVRSSSRELGADVNALFDSFSIGHFISGGGNLSAILNEGDVTFFLKAISSQGYGKILAEPTLVTISGKPARFLAGGEFAVPTTVGVGGVGAATTEFRGFGTELEFTPTVMDKDLVRLDVSPSFSTLNSDATVGGIPGLNRRSVQTTVDLREGQWLAIAGLIQDEQSGQRTRLPIVGDMPIVGNFFGDQNANRFETELIVLVSPELVHPMESVEVPMMLPGMEVTDPTDRDFFINRRIEGRRGFDHRSTITTGARSNVAGVNQSTRSQTPKTRQQIKIEQSYISGPSGFSK